MNQSDLFTPTAHTRTCAAADLAEAIRKAEADGYRVASMDVLRGGYRLHLEPARPCGCDICQAGRQHEQQ